MKRVLSLALLSAAALPLSSSPLRDAATAPGEGAAVLFYGGTIHRLDLGGTAPDGTPLPPARDASARAHEALLAEDGVIVAIGDFETVSGMEEAQDAELVDLEGGHAFPGFQDAHGHVERYGALLEAVDLRGCPSFEELIRRVEERAAALPKGQWVRGHGWDQTLWPGGRFPEHAELSARVPDHPVLVQRIDGHAVLANRAALALAGLAGESLPEDPAGGRIVRDGKRTTGVFIDTAMELVRAHVPDPTDEVRQRHILLAQDALLARGITCVHDMGEDPSGARLLRALEAGGELRMRVVGYMRASEIEAARGFEGVKQPFDDRDVYGVPGVKFVVDGALGSRGAALIEEYSDAPGERGLARFDADRFARRVDLAARAGLQPATHAIGDRANRTVLDAYERVQQRGTDLSKLRPRIEHAQVVAPFDFARFGSLGVIPSMQPTHATSDMRWAVERLGEQRAKGAYAWRRLSNSTPLPLAFGSDFPAEQPDPLLGFHASLTRQDASGNPKDGFFPAERLDASAALSAITSGAAFAAGQEDRRGRLAPGYGCDLTVVDVDLTRLNAGTADTALDAQILMTVVNGAVLFRGE